MVEFPESQLPREPEYWEELAQRITRDAAVPLASYAARRDSWYEILSQRASWLLTSSSAAMLVLWLALPARLPTGDFGWVEGALVPREFAGALLGGAAPPPVDDLIVEFTPLLPEEREQR